MTKTQKKWLLLAILLIGFAILKFILIERFLQQDPQSDNIELSCDLQSSCQLSPTTSVSLKKQNDKTWQLTVNGEAKTAPQASFTMPNMDMGFNQYTLQAKPSTLNVWEANLHLPVCASGRKDWVMALSINGKTYHIPFKA